MAIVSAGAALLTFLVVDALDPNAIVASPSSFVTVAAGDYTENVAVPTVVRFFYLPPPVFVSLRRRIGKCLFLFLTSLVRKGRVFIWACVFLTKFILYLHCLLFLANASFGAGRRRCSSHGTAAPRHRSHTPVAGQNDLPRPIPASQFQNYWPGTVFLCSTLKSTNMCPAKSIAFA
jgi:hypothetical protein